MKCKYITQRMKNYEKYLFCRLKKTKVDFSKCSNCNSKEFKSYKKITKKSNKLKQLESKRYSILTNDLEYCYVCAKEKKMKKKNSIHEIFGGRNRQVSIRNGFCIPICEECHTQTEEDMEFDKEFKRECQKKFEENHTRDEFLELIDKNYLDY